MQDIIVLLIRAALIEWSVRTGLTIDSITTVAIKRNGIVYSLPKPNRHYNIAKLTPTRDILASDICGFITVGGRFLNRKEAFLLAIQTGQIKRDPKLMVEGEELYSEDLW
jgi:hypothetical protein